MAASNKFASAIEKISLLPQPVRGKAVTTLFGAVVKFFRTGRLEILELEPNRAHLRMKNRKRVQNHIGTPHAAAMALLAESATGLVVGMNLPDDRVPVLKTLHVDYVKRATGGLEAVARLTDADIQRIQSEPKGDVVVPVTVTDSKGVMPIECQITWAWTPTRR